MSVCMAILNNSDLRSTDVGFLSGRFQYWESRIAEEGYIMPMSCFCCMHLIKYNILIIMFCMWNILRSHFGQVIHTFFSTHSETSFHTLWRCDVYFREAPGKPLQVSVVENSRSAPLKQHLAETHHARVPRDVYSNWHAQEFPVVFSGESH